MNASIVNPPQKMPISNIIRRVTVIFFRVTQLLNRVEDILSDRDCYMGLSLSDRLYVCMNDFQPCLSGSIPDIYPPNPLDWQSTLCQMGQRPITFTLSTTARWRSCLSWANMGDMVLYFFIASINTFYYIVLHLNTIGV